MSKATFLKCVCLQVEAKLFAFYTLGEPVVIETIAGFLSLADVIPNVLEFAYIRKILCTRRTLTLANQKTGLKHSCN